MQGLLDFIKTPEGQGLLSGVFGYAANARKGAPINSLGRGGLAGLMGYSNAIDREQQAQEANTIKDFRTMQMDRMRQQMEAEQAAEAERQRLKGVVSNALMGVPPTQAISADASGPTVKKAEMIGQRQQLDPRQLIAQGVPLETVKQLMEVPNFGRSKVARTAEVEGPNGSKRIVQLDEYGNEVGTGMAGYIAPVQVDTGDRKLFVKPTAGQTFNVGMSPSEQAANARGWADIRTKQDANEINRTAARTQVVEGADGNVYLVDKGTGLSRQTATLGGKPVQAGKAAEDGIKRGRDADDAVGLVNMARELLPNATNSGIGSLIDAAGRQVGMSSTGAQAAARLEAIGGALVMKMPRMEGPQSNLDQMLYREMAGKVGDRTVPAAERLAALKTVEDLFSKYTSGKKPASAGDLGSGSFNPNNNLFDQADAILNGGKNGNR